MTSTVAPRFSVVVPAYNEADHLGACLDSLAAQDFAGAYEVIVVDNASTDTTASLARGRGSRVVRESQPGVCPARQAGTDQARGEIVVSTDADTTHPADWLTRIDAQFAAHPGVVAVAGPCRYIHPPWWGHVFPPLWFRANAAWQARIGRLFYLSATNVAFRRAGFPGYDTTLHQGGDEVDLLRRLQRWGRVRWDQTNPVDTSSRRLHQGLAHLIVVSFGYHYGGSLLVNRLAGRSVIGEAPAVRGTDHTRVRRTRRLWQVALSLGLAAAVTVRLGRRRRG